MKGGERAVQEGQTLLNQLFMVDARLNTGSGRGRSTAGYLRVVPNWVSRMKAAVDSAETQN